MTPYHLERTWDQTWSDNIPLERTCDQTGVTTYSHIYSFVTTKSIVSFRKETFELMKLGGQFDGIVTIFPKKYNIIMTHHHMIVVYLLHYILILVGIAIL